MAVITKYIVERNGEEKMTFTSKKEADAYDKMLDTADEMAAFLQTGPVALDEQQLEELGLYLASNKEDVMQLLKGNKVAAAKTATTDKKVKDIKSAKPAA
ncbi:YebG family protein [Motilimonas pumila]|uniref:Multidrug DMT transporter permease n=1 Tax=Motilimonas pumila TaxID=2303987 RepID=A0A418YCL7_9GAMM|nr:YebG family protein [Motilimonas pumila]RJG42266.1 multidrug DMT transporter permease [Motilimonas pumila]